MSDVKITGGREWLATLAYADRGCADEVEKVNKRGGLNIKNDWRRRWAGHARYPALPYAISFDTFRDRDEIRTEVGPDKDKTQGALGNIIEFGTPDTAPNPGGLPALDAELPKYEKALLDLGVHLLEK